MRYTLPSLHCGPSYPLEHKHLSGPTHFPFTHDLHSAVEDNGSQCFDNTKQKITTLVYENKGLTIIKLYFLNLNIKAALTNFCPVDGIGRSSDTDVPFYKVYGDCVTSSCLFSHSANTILLCFWQSVEYKSNFNSHVTFVLVFSYERNKYAP